MAKKINLSKEAKNTTSDAEVSEITDAFLREICPKTLISAFKACKTPAARADFLYMVDKKQLKEVRDTYNEMDNFVNKLEAWFIQKFQDDQKGVIGTVAKVEVKNKEIASVQDWDKFYTHIKKKNEFDLLNKAVNQKAVQARWESNKKIPGVEKFIKKVVSLTKRDK